MELREILEALDIAAKEKDGTAIIPRNLAEDARDALVMLAERPRCRERKGGELRYGANTYAGALRALGALRKEAERPEDQEAVSLLLEAVAEKAEREYPDRFRPVGRFG